MGFKFYYGQKVHLYYNTVYKNDEINIKCQLIITINFVITQMQSELGNLELLGWK